MKQSLFTLLLFTSILSANAQKNDIKVKKGKILKKEIPIANIAGKGGIFKAYDLTVSSLTNKPLIRIRQDVYNLKSPLYLPYIYYHISFFNAANTEVNYCLVPLKAQHVESEIASFMFSDTTGINLLENDSTLSEEGINQFVKKYHRDLKADSTNKMQYLKAISNALEGNASRRMNQQVILKMTNKREGFYNAAYKMTNEYEYEIIQDAVVIGTVTKTISETATGGNNRIVVKKAVLKPFEWNGVKQFYAEAAVMEIDGQFGSIHTFYDGKRHELPPGNGNASEYIIATFLINKGYL